MTVEPIVVRVLFDVNRLSINKQRYMHPMKLSSLAKASKRAALIGWYEAGQPVLDVPLTVSITVRRARRIDPDGVLTACKWIIDQLFCRNRNLRETGLAVGMTPDDNARWLEYAPVRQEAGKEWKGREEVEISVVPREVANG